MGSRPWSQVCPHLCGTSPLPSSRPRLSVPVCQRPLAPRCLCHSGNRKCDAGWGMCPRPYVAHGFSHPLQDVTIQVPSRGAWLPVLSIPASFQNWAERQTSGAAGASWEQRRRAARGRRKLPGAIQNGPCMAGHAWPQPLIPMRAGRPIVTFLLEAAWEASPGRTVLQGGNLCSPEMMY